MYKQQKKMNIIEYADNQQIKKMTVPLKWEHGKKSLDTKTGGKIYGYGKFSPNTIKQSKEYLDFVFEKHPDIPYVGIDTSQVAQLDFDLHNGVQYPQKIYDWINEVKANTPWYASVSKEQGLHAFVKIPAKYHEADRWETREKCPVNGSAIADLLTGQWAWARKDIIVENASCPMMTLTEDKIDLLFKMTGKTKAKKQKQMNTTPQPIKEIELKSFTPHQRMLLELGKLFSQNHIDRYNNWIRWVSSLYNDSPDNFTIAKIISSYSKYYDLDELKYLWSRCRANNTIGTFYYFAKECNEEKYRQIRMKYHIKSCDLDFSTDEELAKYFIDNQGEDIIYKDDTIYHYDKYKGRWIKDNPRTLGMLQSKVRKEIGVFCKSFIQEIAELLADEDISSTSKEYYEKLDEEVRKLRLKIKNICKSDSVCKMVKQVLSINPPAIEFDTKGHLFSFENITFNLNTGEEVIPDRYDYQSATTGYPFRNPTEDELKELYALEDTIFPIDEHKQFYRKVMATSLFGTRPEMFVLANGSGGNGKGVWHELASTSLGNYYYNAPCEVLLSEKKSGPSPEIANMKDKRLIVMSEPAQNKRINNSLMKELTGGKNIAARMCHSNSCEVRLVGTFIMECNIRPKLQNGTGEGEGRRLIDFPFPSTFTTKTDILEKNYQYTFKANPYYKTPEFQDKYKYAWFILYLKYIQTLDKPLFEDLSPPEDIKARTQEHIDNSNDFLQEIQELISLKPVGDDKTKNYIKIRDIHDRITQTHFYTTLSKAEQREYKLAKTKEFFQTTIPYKGHYVEKLNVGKTTVRSVLCFAEWNILDASEDDGLDI